MEKFEAWHKATPSSPFLKPKSKSVPKAENFLQKLFVRENCGKFKSGFAKHEPKVRPFTRLPGRLAFCLRDVVPLSSLEAGHVFLGFSKCGQFLLSYTQSHAENVDLDMAMDSWRIPYHFRLHWWLFTPYKKVKKVAEVMLFTNAGTDMNLHLSFCQWPKDNSKVLVFGYLKSDLDIKESSMTSSLPCYITVTAVPSLNGCQDCIKVAASYDEEELAAAWNSCARLSCLEHGFTIHSSFDLVPPYPRFEPRISLKCDSSVVINTGNLLHCLNFNLEKAKCKSNNKTGQNPAPAELMKFAQQWASATVNPHLFSPPHAPSVASDSDFTASSDCESEFGYYSAANKRKTRPGLTRQNLMSEERLQRVAEFAAQLSPPRSAGISSFVAWHGIKRKQPIMATDDTTKKKVAADKAFELTDDNFETETVQEKLSTFRRKRLAEKRYAFTDDAENITPLSQLRKQSQELQLPPEPSTSSATAATNTTTTTNVLRPLSANTDLSDLFEVPELLSPGGMVKKDQLASPRSDSQSQHPAPPLRFNAKFTRTFVELDEEAISVMTEIEDDDHTGAGYHSALPLEVHGTAYQPMAMISNTKAEKLGNKSCLKVGQTSLDVELLCHDMAQKLCSAAGKKYWFCNDYDVEIIDLDPNSDEVICVAVVQVRATVVMTSTKKVSTDENYSYSSLQRHLYQGGFKFCWNIASGQYYVLDSEPLSEIFQEPRGFWHPARGICMNLQKQWKCFNGGSEVRCMTNDSVINDTSLKTIVDSENFVAIILDDLK